ncbi:MAG: M56 family metallopeptidase [Leptolyngbya sp. SIO4C1]|nr:M56 family metallopeptidase [Leptolyngbya sp. SIO4C1]
MHLTLTLAALGLACGWRLSYRSQGTVVERWHRALLSFLVPILLLTTSAIAILCMGPSGQMVTYWEGWSTYSGAIGLLVLALGWMGYLAIAAWRSLRSVRQQPLITLLGYRCRLLDLELPYSAQIGFWQPELVVSQGLVDLLDEAHLRAVLLHEAGHHHYRDTFWFFWLGWLKALTGWLPQTERLWQELLLLREIRADCWAAAQTEPLLLAESLVEVARAPWLQTQPHAAAFSCNIVNLRLQERVEALLNKGWQPAPRQLGSWLWLLFAALPLITIPFHH